MKRWTALAPFSALALVACAASSYYQAYPSVPPPQAELVPTPPRSSAPLIWQPGHYDWDGQVFRWTAGRWVGRAGHGTLWQDGYWERHAGAYAWVPAHWM